MPRDIAHKPLPSLLIEDPLPQRPRRIEVLRANLRQERNRLALEVRVRGIDVHRAGLELDRRNGREVIRAAALVVKRHHAVALEVAHPIRDSGSVDGELLVVSSHAVAVGIGVAEETGLQDRVGGGLNAWHEMGGGESDLLDFGEVVLCVFVEVEFADFAQGELFLWPDVREVEHVDFLFRPQLFGFQRRHCLHADVPAWVLAVLDGVVEIFLRMVWRMLGRVRLCDEFGALLGLHVHLRVDPVALAVDELERVAAVAVHEAVAVGDTAVTHQHHDLVDRLGVLGKVVPEHGAVVTAAEVGGWVALLRVDEVRELGWVAKEEDGRVVGHEVPIALFGPELHGEATRVTGTVVRALLATDGAEADSDRTHFARFEEIRRTQVIKRVGRLVVAVGSGALCVDDTLRDSLAVEVREQVDEMEVLEQQWAIVACTLGLVWVRVGSTVAQSVEHVLGGRVLVIVVVSVEVAVPAAVCAE